MTRPSTDGKIRVLQVIYSMHIGGAENAVVHLAEQLDRARFDVEVCCTRELGVRADRLMAKGIPVSLAAPSHRALRYLTPLNLYRAIRKYRPHVIHTHSTPSLLHAGPLGTLGLLPWWVHTFHFGNYPLPDPREMRAERVLCRRPSQLVAVAEPQRQAIIQHHGLAPESIITIVNGVEENPFVADGAVRAQKRLELGLGPDDTVVGCIAVLTVQKGVTHFLAAAKQILGLHPNVRFLVVGGGPLEEPLRQEAAALGLGSRIVFTGWRQDNLALLAALDVFVMSSLWEAMPLALLEAMAARRAIVVTDVGDNRRIVDYGRCGLIVPPSNPDAIASAVAALLSDPASAAAMADRAYQQFSSRFTTGHMLAEYQRLYERGVTRPASASLQGASPSGTGPSHVHHER